MSKITFSQKLKRLEEIVSLLESPEVELEDGLKLLEEGVELHRECQQMLTQTQAKITKLLSTSAPAESAAAESVEIESKLEATTLFETAENSSTDDESSTDRLPF